MNKELQILINNLTNEELSEVVEYCQLLLEAQELDPPSR
jgi:hypothetical protein